MSAFNASTLQPFNAPASAKPPQRAFVLIAVLVLVMLISMIAVSLLFRLKAENSAAGAIDASEQAWSAAMSGVQEAMRIAAGAAPGSTDWQDLPAACRDRFVFDDGSDQWFFTICSPGFSESLAELRYGLTDEAGKINLNYADTADLSHLPQLTPALIAAARDFIDPDETIRPEGAEQEYYDTLSRPYAVPNRPLDSIDQLLLIRGFTPALVYGEDVNQNWRLDPNENDGEERFPPDNNDSKLDLGLRQFLTVSSYEPNQDNDGVPRTNLNDPNDPLPGVELPAALTNFIAVARSNKVQFACVADLLDGKIKLKDSKGRETEIASGIGKEELPAVLDLFTTTKDFLKHGLINVNTAPAPVLASVPGIDEPLAESIVSTRRAVSAERRMTIAWLYQEGVVDAPRFKEIAPYLTARSFQYSFHVVGYGVPSGRYRVFEVIIDVAEGEPRIAYLRDLTRLGLPFTPGAERIEIPVAQRVGQKGVRHG